MGAAIGANGRYLLTLAFDPKPGHGFPWGTLVVNSFGSLAIGLVLGSLVARPIHPKWEVFLVVGVLGGFTTFSSFSAQNLALLREDRFWLFLTYSFVSLFGGLLLAGIGYEIARRALPVA